MARSIDLGSVVVHQWQCDHFGHWNVRHYAAAFDDAIFVFWNRMRGQQTGTDEQFVPVTAELKLSLEAEMTAGQVAVVSGEVLRAGTKSAVLGLKLSSPSGDAVFARCEAVEVYFDKRSRTSTAIPPGVKDRLLGAVSEESKQNL